MYYCLKYSKVCLNLPTKHPLKFRIVDGGSYYILKAWTRMMLLCVQGTHQVKQVKEM